MNSRGGWPAYTVRFVNFAHVAEARADHMLAQPSPRALELFVAQSSEGIGLLGIFNYSTGPCQRGCRRTASARALRWALSLFKDACVEWAVPRRVYGGRVYRARKAEGNCWASSNLPEIIAPLVIKLAARSGWKAPPQARSATGGGGHPPASFSRGHSPRPDGELWRHMRSRSLGKRALRGRAGAEIE